MTNQFSPATLRTLSRFRGSLVLCLALCSVELGLSRSAHAATFTTFDAPGATATFPQSINPAGEIAGYYVDASFVWHGFLRAPDGTFTTFDAPGAVFGTFAVSINPAGAITGFYVDASGVAHGFLRSR